MKAQWLQASAAAAAISLSVGAANAATYDLDYNPLFGDVTLTTGTVTIDSSVTGVTFAGFPGVGVTSSTITGNIIDVVLSYLGGPYLVRYSLAADGFSGAYGLFSGTTYSFANLLSLGSFTYDEVIPVEPVPLPATLPLLAAALGAAGIASRRRKAA